MPVPAVKARAEVRGERLGGVPVLLRGCAVGPSSACVALLRYKIWNGAWKEKPYHKRCVLWDAKLKDAGTFLDHLAFNGTSVAWGDAANVAYDDAAFFGAASTVKGLDGFPLGGGSSGGRDGGAGCGSAIPSYLVPGEEV